ncbi:MAG TPA: hypothetical protein VL688_13215 [Verrucomicrobiae bacterium]|nr:hypothetical protein [Verrucomicrobiae bacterium]
MADKKTFYRVLDVLIAALYLGIVAFLAFHHEPWSDETQPWLLARDTTFPAFVKYLAGNYDNHPSLWYLILRPFARTGFPFAAQQIIHVILAFGAVLLFVFRSPFPRPTKYLWIFSYLMLFEYAVVSRMYALAILLIFSIAALYPKRFRHPYAFASLVFLLCHADYLSFGLAFGIGSSFAFESGMRRRKENAPVPWGALALMALGGLLTFLQVMNRPADHCHAHTYVSEVWRHAKPLWSLSKGFIPVEFDVSETAAKVLALTVLGCAIAALWRKGTSLWILFCGYAEIFMILTFSHYGDIRHYGFYAVILLFVLWTSRSEPEAEAVETRAGENVPLREKAWGKALLVLNVCFLLSLRGSYTAARYEIYLPFSGGLEMAGIINKLFKENGLDEKGIKIVAHTQYRAISIMPFMPRQRQFWYPNLKDYGSYYTCDSGYYSIDKIPVEEVIARAREHFGTLDPLIFVLDKPLDSPLHEGYNFVLLASAEQGVWGTNLEKFYLYKPMPQQ